MALVDIMLAFPQLILAFAMVAVLGPGIGTIILVLGLTGWERYARVVGLKCWRCVSVNLSRLPVPLVSAPTIIFRHLLPNTFSSVIVMATLQAAQTI